MRLATTVLALIVAAHTSGATRARYLMGTLCEVSASDEGQIDAAFADAARVEAMLSTWRDDSELARFNADRSTPISPELAALLRVVEEQRVQTGGAFEPRIRPLIDAWKTRESGALPDAATIASALERIRAGNAPIEEGAFGKGYALDRMLAVILEECEVIHPPPDTIAANNVVLNFGGQLLVRGAYEVTIADPEHRDRPRISLTLANASLSTSSGSEKTFVVDGRTFTHIFDPRTGEALPPRGSVSVVASSALLADIESTALYVMGVDDGLRWANANGVAALFIARDGTGRTSVRASRTFPKFKTIKD
jgi:thiamine biosynthesis lipoprotein